MKRKSVDVLMGSKIKLKAQSLRLKVQSKSLISDFILKSRFLPSLPDRRGTLVGVSCFSEKKSGAVNLQHRANDDSLNLIGPLVDLEGLHVP